MWKQISNEEYHSEYKSFLSSSDIRRLLRSPAHYRTPVAGQTPAQEIGTLAHVAILEPDMWKACYQLSPKLDRRTKDGKALAEWQLAQENQRGIKFIQEDLYSQIEGIAESVRSSMGTSGLLSNGMAELSGFGEINSQPIRIRPDYLRDDVIVDLKTCFDAREFQKSVFQWGYDLQAALYCDMAQIIDGKKRGFIWIVVEKDAPYGCMIFEATEEVLTRGRALYEKAIQIYQECASLDHWPSYSPVIQQLTVPRWLKENV